MFTSQNVDHAHVSLYSFDSFRIKFWCLAVQCVIIKMREVSFLERETYLVMSLLLFGCTAHRQQQQQTAPTMKFTVEYSVMWLLVRFNPATTGNKWNRTQHWRYNFIVTTEAHYSCFGKCWTENRVWKSGQHLSKFQFPASECTLFNCCCCCFGK